MKKKTVKCLKRFLFSLNEPELLDFAELMNICIYEENKDNKIKIVEYMLQEIQEIDEMYLPEVLQDIIDECE